MKLEGLPGDRAAFLSGWLLRLAALFGLAIFVLVLAVSPTGLALAIAFFFPVFIPALIGVIIGLVGRSQGNTRTRQIVAACLMLPGFALAAALAVNYSPDASDTPAAHGEAAARAIEMIAPIGALTAVAGLIVALIRRRRAPARIWSWLIAVVDLLVFVTALSASVPN
ncbi:MAG: hypothetical protein QOG53_650 [Frankiales bacterium]|jgi:hypothetical protein|nr:hypothetical protein [Frankiales bacterium]